MKRAAPPPLPRGSGGFPRRREVHGLVVKPPDRYSGDLDLLKGRETGNARLFFFKDKC